MTFFKDSEEEIDYIGLNLQPLIFQHDVCRLFSSVKDVQAGNDKMEAVTETKLLDLNLDKSVYIVIGDKKARKEINQQLIDNPFTLCDGVPIQQVTSDRYLGDQGISVL